MAATSALEQWLHQVILPYIHQRRVFHDVLDLLNQHASLSPKFDLDAMDMPPSNHRYLALAGTLPITFRGQTYHIPLSIWLPYEYPTLKPRVRVEPTETMCIRPGRCVDPEGRVRHPYLDYWQERTQKSDLVQLVNNLQTAFSDEPPVYARPVSMPYVAPKGASSVQHIVRTASPVAVPRVTASPVAAIQHIAQTTRAYSPLKPMQNERLQELRQKLRTRLREQLGPWHAQAHQEVNQLLANNAKLTSSEEQVNQVKLRLESIKSRLREKLEAAVRDVRAWQTENQRLEAEPPLETEQQLVRGADSAGDALFTCHAQEHAIDDTIDQLRHALLSNRIDLQTFLKHVRRLAREQYMIKASINKATPDWLALAMSDSMPSSRTHKG